VSQKPKPGRSFDQRNTPAVIAAALVVAVLVLVALNLGNTPSAADPGTVTMDITPEPMPTAEAPATDPVAPEKQYAAAPPMTIDASKNYTATIKTPRGDIVVKLRPDLAPETVNSFVFLSKEGFYDGVTFHRVIQDFMAQGGDPTGTGLGGAGYTVKAEFSPSISFDKPGYLAMARPGNDIDGNGSQFFITTAPANLFDGQYNIFGEVISGQDIVNGIPLRDPETATASGEAMQTITISEN
jgi:peptidylprolyl isomerase